MKSLLVLSLMLAGCVGEVSYEQPSSEAERVDQSEFTANKDQSTPGCKPFVYVEETEYGLIIVEQHIVCQPAEIFKGDPAPLMKKEQVYDPVFRVR